MKLKRSPPSSRHFDASARVDIVGVSSTVASSSRSSNPLDKYAYEGYLIDEPTESSASGIVLDNGLFYGTIVSPRHGGKFVIESSRRYHHHPAVESNASLHATPDLIIYNEKDVSVMSKRAFAAPHTTAATRAQEGGDDDDHAPKTSLHCGASLEHVNKWLSGEQSRVYEERKRREGFDPFEVSDDMDDDDERTKYTKRMNPTPSKRTRRSSNDMDDALSKNISNSSSDQQQRALNNSLRLQFPDMRTVCSLYLKVDFILYKEIYDNEGNRNADTTNTFLLYLLNEHVKFLNSVYHTLPFFDARRHAYFIGLQFMIHRTRITPASACEPGHLAALGEQDRLLCEQYLDVSTFLNHVSLDDHSDYCLSYTFTARDFADGTLGLHCNTTHNTQQQLYRCALISRPGSITIFSV